MGCRSLLGGRVITMLLILAWCAPGIMAAEAKKDERKAAGRRPAADARQASPPHAGPETPAPAAGAKEKHWTAANDVQGHKEAILAALKHPTQMEFTDESFQNIIDYLKDKHKIEIQLDRKALEEVGFATDKQMTINVKGLTLRSALALLLHAEGLTWTIRDEVLLITTPDEDQNALTTELYEVADLVACKDEKGQPWDDYGTLVELIASHIEPTSWDAVGGPGAITGATFGSAKVIVVTQTFQIHERIEDLLARIRAIGAKSKGDKTLPVRPRPQPPRAHKESAPSQDKQSPPQQGGMGGGPAPTR
jgi:hypothetical protein